MSKVRSLTDNFVSYCLDPILAVERRCAPKWLIFVTVCSYEKTKVAETGIFVVSVYLDTGGYKFESIRTRKATNNVTPSSVPEFGDSEIADS